MVDFLGNFRITFRFDENFGLLEAKKQDGGGGNGSFDKTFVLLLFCFH